VKVKVQFTLEQATKAQHLAQQYFNFRDNCYYHLKEFKELHTIQNYKEYLSMIKYENSELSNILVSDIISVAKLLRWKDNIKMDLTQLN
jgi:hypothetical protein